MKTKGGSANARTESPAAKSRWPLIITLVIALGTGFGCFMLIASRSEPVLLQSAPASIELLTQFGDLQHRLGKVDLALKYYHAAVEILHRAGAVSTPEGIAVLRRIAQAVRQSRPDGLEDALADSLAGYKALIQALEAVPLGTLRDLLLSQLADPVDELKSIGMAKMNKVRIENEIKLWEVAVDMVRATGRFDTVKAAEMLTRVGVAWSRTEGEAPEKKTEKVMDYYAQAKQLFEDTHSTDTHWYAILVHNMGVCYGSMGEAAKEHEHMEQAVNIYASLDSNGTDTYACLLYELAGSRESQGDEAGGREAFLRANAIYDAKPNWYSKLRATYVVNLGMSRFDRGYLPGALEALEIAVRVHTQMGTLKTPDGETVLRNIKAVEKAIQSLPEPQGRKVYRRLEVLRRPSEPEGSGEEGAYLQHAGR